MILGYNELARSFGNDRTRAKRHDPSNQDETRCSKNLGNRRRICLNSCGLLLAEYEQRACLPRWLNRDRACRPIIAQKVAISLTFRTFKPSSGDKPLATARTVSPS
jgi:hypothetical protein